MAQQWDYMQSIINDLINKITKAFRTIALGDDAVIDWLIKWVQLLSSIA